MSADYEYVVYCQNCGKETRFMIPFGMTAKNYLMSKNTVCSGCGCESIREKNVNPSINEHNNVQKELLHD